MRVFSGALLLAVLALLFSAGCDKSGGTPDGGSGPSCELPEVVVPDVNPDARRFALSVFHFNLEYVMGGLDGDGEGGRFPPFCGSMCEGWDNDAVEDWILRESFIPVVDFYHEHPQWGATLEMQGYLIEVLAERFPEVIPRLREIVARGQVELSSFHYADQLFLAFPARDLERSQALTRQLFSEHCLPLSEVVFDQEGQAGAGWLTYLGSHGYRIGIFPKNLYRYQHGSEVVWQPLYGEGDTRMIIGPGGVDPASGIELAWPFFDDGELLAVTGGLAPYLAPIIEFDPERLEVFAAELQGLEDAGYQVTTVENLVAHLEAAGVAPTPVPPLLDGTWQAPSTDSIHRWLGGRGEAPYWGDEQDNAVRSANYRASTRLAAAEAAFEWATAEGRVSNQPDFEGAWKALFHAEVSDGSGVNPWAAEVYWSLDHSEEVLAFAAEVLDEVKLAAGAAHLSIDLETGSVTSLADPPTETGIDAPAPPVTISLTAGDRTVSEQWQSFPGSRGRYRLTVTFGPGTDEDLDRILVATFPRTEERLRFSPGLIEDAIVDWPLSDFVFDWGETYLPLTNGLIGLGDDLWVIKHARVVHLAARIDAGAPVIEFIDEVAPLASTEWVFEIFEGDAASALALARKINTHPTVIWPDAG